MLLAWSPGASAQNGSSTPPLRDGASYEVKLRELRERVEELHQQLRMAQVRAAMAAGAVSSVATGAPVAIDVRDVTTSALIVTGIRVWLDDELVYVRSSGDGALGEARAASAFHGVVVAGDHTVRVQVLLAGNGAVLPYMRAYHFEINADRRLSVDHLPARVDIRIYERGDVTTPLEQRPALAITAY
jgi:hypothetical protein